jgi:hypothetical protein
VVFEGDRASIKESLKNEKAEMEGGQGVYPAFEPRPGREEQGRASSDRERGSLYVRDWRQMRI